LMFIVIRRGVVVVYVRYCVSLFYFGVCICEKLVFTMNASDIASSDVDPTITIEDLKSQKSGMTFPNKQGFAYAYYALQQFPESVTVDEAVTAKKNYVAPKLTRYEIAHRKRKQVCDFITSIDGIDIVNHNTVRTGRTLTVIHSNEFRKDWSHQGATNRVGHVEFVVSSKKEATKAAKSILRAIKRMPPLKHPVKRLSFSYTDVFVGSD
jgi:hypothetical protein